MPMVDVGRIELYYERAGEGRPLLYINGTGADLRVKPNVLDGPLVNGFDVLTYDQRGLGRSAKPDVAYSTADYADDAAALMDWVGWKSARLIGVSFGGMVAQELALRHPGKVERLVLACTSPRASFPLHEIQHLTGEARAKRLIPLGDTRRDSGWADAHPGSYAQIVAMAAAAVADPYACEPGRDMGARRQLEARAAHDTWDRLDQIRCPVMIAAGRYDGLALPETQERMASRIPNAALRFFEGGHSFMVQDGRALPAMVEFLRR